MADPTRLPRAGRVRLRAAGIEVVVLGVQGEEAGRKNKIFFQNLRNPARPFIGLKLATTLDARIADQAGRSRWISGDEARDYVHWLRAGFDAIAVGAHTATVDDASLTVRGDWCRGAPGARGLQPRATSPLRSAW
ncbi:MAG: dihydrofolate reductase family protein [Gemmatimonadales bacterium]